MPKICEELGCTKQSSYGLVRGKGPRWCKAHAPPDARNVAHRRCEGAPGGAQCDKQPNFALSEGPPGAPKRPRWCKTCAPPGAVDVMKRHCAAKGCWKQPWYGMRRGERPMWCKAHAPPGARNIVDKECAHPGCSTIPSFGMRGGRPLWCRAHAPREALNVRASGRRGREAALSPAPPAGSPAPAPAARIPRTVTPTKPPPPPSGDGRRGVSPGVRGGEVPDVGGHGGGGRDLLGEILGPILSSRVLSK